MSRHVVCHDYRGIPSSNTAIYSASNLSRRQAYACMPTVLGANCCLSCDFTGSVKFPLQKQTSYEDKSVKGTLYACGWCSKLGTDC